METVGFGELRRLAKRGDTCACAALHRMAHVIGIGAAMLVAGLSPDVIVLVGEVTGAWKRIGPIIKEAVQRRQIGRRSTRVLPIDPQSQPRLRGAVALVLQKRFEAFQCA